MSNDKITSSQSRRTYEKPTVVQRSNLLAVTAEPLAISGSSSGGGNASDRRLKTHVRALEKTANGIQLYTFRYFWSAQTFVGVMAQDLLDQPEFAHAVIVGKNDFYRVNYDALGLRMVTLEEWEATPMAAIAGPAQVPLAAIS